MKKVRAVLLCLCMAVLLSACFPLPVPTEPAETFPPVTEPPVTIPPVTAPPVTVPPETEPPHSPYYLPYYLPEDVVFWFQEVALAGEFPEDPEDMANYQVKRWENEIRYQIVGAPTEEDLVTVRDFWDRMGQIKGFPPVTETDCAEDANYVIHFYTHQDMMESDETIDNATNGFVRVWWNGNLELESAMVYICTEDEQHYRNRVIRHELYQSLGMLQDTIREDSMIYQMTLEADDYSELDMLLMQLLYHEDIAVGMGIEECTQVIEALYY